MDIEFNGELHDNQKDAIAALTKYDNGILSAATAFGKTVACSGIISQIKTSTLSPFCDKDLLYAPDTSDCIFPLAVESF